MLWFVSCAVPEWGGGGVLCWVSCRWFGVWWYIILGAVVMIAGGL